MAKSINWPKCRGSRLCQGECEPGKCKKRAPSGPYGKFPVTKPDLSSRELRQKAGEIRHPARLRRDMPKIDIEGICKNGDVRSIRVPWPGCSTGVARMKLLHKTPPHFEKMLWLIRVFHDGRLVQEWNEQLQQYVLDIDEPWRMLLLTSPKDRLYRAKDGSWWNRETNGSLLRADPPLAFRASKLIRKARREISKLVKGLPKPRRLKP